MVCAQRNASALHSPWFHFSLIRLLIYSAVAACLVPLENTDSVCHVKYGVILRACKWILAASFGRELLQTAGRILKTGYNIFAVACRENVSQQNPAENTIKAGSCLGCDACCRVISRWRQVGAQSATMRMVQMISGSCQSECNGNI